MFLLSETQPHLSDSTSITQGIHKLLLSEKYASHKHCIRYANTVYPFLKPLIPYKQ